MANEIQGALRDVNWLRNTRDNLAAMTDYARWFWIRSNSAQMTVAEITLLLDNDDTMIVFNSYEAENADIEAVHFDKHIGNAPGLYELLDSLGIPAEAC